MQECWIHSFPDRDSVVGCHCDRLSVEKHLIVKVGIFGEGGAAFPEAINVVPG